MLSTLTQEDIVKFIEQYGDEDIYFSHYKETNGNIIVKYLPSFTKFLDPINILPFKKELTENPHLKDKYLMEIILTPKYAYLPNNSNSDKSKLVVNYKKFLDDLKKEKAAKYAIKNEYCKPENVKSRNHNKSNKYSRNR